MDLKNHIQKISMNITFSPYIIIFNLVRLLHPCILKKLQGIPGACSKSNCALNKKCIPKPFGEHDCVLSGINFLCAFLSFFSYLNAINTFDFH